jgi:hypothetical protein
MAYATLSPPRPGDECESGPRQLPFLGELGEDEQYGSAREGSIADPS